ncbi:MAG TPA: alpha/beta hydrolase [Ilumatobacteraceae bacterium]
MLIPSTDGVLVCTYDLAGPADAQPLVMSHATGFHGYCYQPIAEELAPAFHSIGFDYRGHGDTAQPANVGVDWRRYTDDVEAVAATIPSPFPAFGHSMGGACLLMAAHRRPHLFSHLVIYEPVIFPPDVSPERGPSQLVDSTRRRRDTFDSYDAALTNFAAKPPLGSFTPAALDAYVKHGFAEGDDGKVHLKCSPELEAMTYEMNRSHSTWHLLPEIDVPVLVVSGRPEPGTVAQFSQDVADRLPNATYMQLDELDHFGPMTHPELVAAIVRDTV